MVNDNREDVRKVISSTPFLVSLFITILIGATLSTTGSVASIHVLAATKPATALPSCSDPTGQNLPCMMIISTLPPPPNVIQCQETSGQTLPCSYATQNLSNGQRVAVITVYVPVNYLFTGYGPWTVVKQVVHETTTKTKLVFEQCLKGQTFDRKTHKCVDIQPPRCQPGQHPELVNGIPKCLPPCERSDSDAVTDLDTKLVTADCDINDPNEHGKTPPPLKCERPDADAKTDPDIDLKTKDCDLGDANEHVTTSPTTPTGAGPECVGNCTTGTPTPPVDCTTNPTDPSCTQTLTPSTTTPTTKTCPDGSVIDASATCPTQPASPNPSNPNSQTPPSNDNNPSSSGSDNGNNNPNDGANSGSSTK